MVSHGVHCNIAAVSMQPGEKWGQNISSLLHVGEGLHQADYASNGHEIPSFVSGWVNCEEFLKFSFNLRKLIVAQIIHLLVSNGKERESLYPCRSSALLAFVQVLLGKFWYQDLSWCKMRLTLVLYLWLAQGGYCLDMQCFLPFGMLSAKVNNPSLLTESIIITVVLCYFLHRIVVDFSTKWISGWNIEYIPNYIGLWSND